MLSQSLQVLLIKLDIINEKFMFYKETIDQIMNDMKELTEITVIKRKIDNIMQQLGNIRNINDDHETKTVKNPLPVEGKYVEITIFNEFTKNHKLEIENINNRIDELKLVNNADSDHEMVMFELSNMKIKHHTDRLGDDPGIYVYMLTL